MPGNGYSFAFPCVHKTPQLLEIQQCSWSYYVPWTCGVPEIRRGGGGLSIINKNPLIMGDFLVLPLPHQLLFTFVYFCLPPVGSLIHVHEPKCSCKALYWPTECSESRVQGHRMHTSVECIHDNCRDSRQYWILRIMDTGCCESWIHRLYESWILWLWIMGGYWASWILFNCTAKGFVLAICSSNIHASWSPLQQ